MAAESFDPEKDSDDNNEEERQIYPKSDSQRARLTNAVKEILLFRCLDEVSRSCFPFIIRTIANQSGQ